MLTLHDALALAQSNYFAQVEAAGSDGDELLLQQPAAVTVVQRRILKPVQQEDADLR